MYNLCPRCGKQRIVAKEWKEKVLTTGGTSVTVTRQLTVCPDPACQALVEQKTAAAFEKSAQVKRDFDKRAEDKKIARSQLRFAKEKKS